MRLLFHFLGLNSEGLGTHGSPVGMVAAPWVLSLLCSTSTVLNFDVCFLPQSTPSFSRVWHLLDLFSLTSGPSAPYRSFSLSSCHVLGLVIFPVYRAAFTGYDYDAERKRRGRITSEKLSGPQIGFRAEKEAKVHSFTLSPCYRWEV